MSPSEPQKPHWHQPSHPSIQKVVHSPTSSPNDFSTKSYSTVTIPPHGVYTTLTFPPCTIAKKGATYATVQVSKDTHINLECDLLYVEHSCDPSLVFDTTHALSSTNPRISICASSRGLSPGDELTFFYPSTEYSMAQGFSCHCSSSNCLGWVQGAQKLTIAQLEGGGAEKRWISPHIRALLSGVKENGQAVNGGENGYKHANGLNGTADGAKARQQRGVTSRALSGEMGGDTSSPSA